MARVRTERIPCYEPLVGDAELRNLEHVLTRNWLSEDTYTRTFEGRLAALCERRFAVACTNATSAMIAGMRGLGLRATDEVVVPSLSHPADPNAIAAAGATPVFADVDETSLCLSPETIDAVRTPRTRAVLLVDLYGNAPDLDALTTYAREHHLFLMNDCAAALAGTFRRRPIASYGTFSALSFFADKTITTGEGGMFLTDDEALMREFNLYKHDGRQERGNDIIERRGYNFRMTELQAAVGVAQLDRLPFFLRRKSEILARYLTLLAGVSGVRVFAFNPEGDVVPHRVLIFVPDADALVAHVSAHGVGVRKLFMPMHGQPCYGATGPFPVTSRLSETGVCLPSAPSLTEEQIAFTCETIRHYYHG